MPKENKFDIAVIGAGPAGMMAAIAAAEKGAKVILIEKNNQLGKKLLLTGNGRCNITNAEFNLDKFAANFGKNGKFLLPALYDFGPKETIAFFNNLGIKTKVENDNRVFPVSDKAIDVLNALKKHLAKNGIAVSFGFGVSRIIFKNSKVEKLVVGKEEISADKYIFSTGGKSYPSTGSTGDGFAWLKDMGHNIVEPSPALVPIKTKENWVKDLQGMALKDVKIRVLLDNKKQFQEEGYVLFAHFGLSGRMILNMSKQVSELLKKGEVKISLDLLPKISMEVLDKNIQKKISENPKKSAKNILAEYMPQRFVDIFVKLADINPIKQANNITKEERKNIAKLLKNVEIRVAGTLGFNLAVVTSGGVSLKEIDNKTMKSKIIGNLYFAGEIIDVDAKTGGFNLQACWSTGHLAGESAA